MSSEQYINVKKLNPDIIPPRSDQYRNSDIKCGSKLVVIGKPGCFEKGTKVLMFDGSIKNVEDVKVGDQVMGDDSTVRNVLELCQNRDTMYKLSPMFGQPYTVNKGHKLVILNKRNRQMKEVTVQRFLSENIDDWLLIKNMVMFPTREIQSSAYGTGLLVGNEDIKYIPSEYMINSVRIRLSFLTGFINSYEQIFTVDGKIRINSSNKQLIDDLFFIFSSVGFFTERKETTVRDTRSYSLFIYDSSKKFFKSHYRDNKVYIYPNIVNEYISYISDPFTNKESITSFYSDFTLENVGDDNYYGFVLDGNHRFLLDSCDVVRNTGKSTLIKSLLYSKKHIFPAALAVSGSEDSNHAYSQFIPKSFIYNEYNEGILTEMVKRQKLASQHLPNPWLAVILDDCTDDPSIFNRPIQQGLYKRGRHLNLMYILSLQYSMDVKPVIRTNIDGTFILREPLKNNRENLYKNYASIIPTYNIFCDLMDQLTDNYCALFILNASKSNDWKDCVYWWKATPAPDDWKLGCSTFWDHHSQRYNENYVDPIII